MMSDLQGTLKIDGTTVLQTVSPGELHYLNYFVSAGDHEIEYNGVGTPNNPYSDYIAIYVSFNNRTRNLVYPRFKSRVRG